MLLVFGTVLGMFANSTKVSTTNVGWELLLRWCEIVNYQVIECSPKEFTVEIHDGLRSNKVDGLFEL